MMFECNVKCESVSHTADGYCKLRVQDAQNTQGILTEGGFISPKAFITHFKQIIEQAKIDITMIGKKYSIRRCEYFDN